MTEDRIKIFRRHGGCFAVIILFFILTIPIHADSQEVTYYFDAFLDHAQTHPVNEANLVDGSTETYADFTDELSYSSLQGTTCTGEILGKITGLEIRYYCEGGYESVILFFNEEYRDEYGRTCGDVGSPGWTAYDNITDAHPYGPSAWEWSDIDNINLHVGNALKSYKVEIRITYESSISGVTIN